LLGKMPTDCRFCSFIGRFRRNELEAVYLVWERSIPDIVRRWWGTHRQGETRRTAVGWKPIQLSFNNGPSLQVTSTLNKPVEVNVQNPPSVLQLVRSIPQRTSPPAWMFHLRDTDFYWIWYGNSLVGVAQSVKRLAIGRRGWVRRPVWAGIFLFTFITTLAMGCPPSLQSSE
jgi:hypothetical protein